MSLNLCLSICRSELGHHVLFGQLLERHLRDQPNDRLFVVRRVRKLSSRYGSGLSNYRGGGWTFHGNDSAEKQSSGMCDDQIPGVQLVYDAFDLQLFLYQYDGRRNLRIWSSVFTVYDGVQCTVSGIVCLNKKVNERFIYDSDVLSMESLNRWGNDLVFLTKAIEISNNWFDN